MLGHYLLDGRKIIVNLTVQAIRFIILISNKHPVTSASKPSQKCITITIDFIIVLIGDDEVEAMEEDLGMDVAFAGNRENSSQSASREARFAPRRNIFNLPCFGTNNINRVVVA